MNSGMGASLLGVLIAVLGVCNMKGHIGSIHWYHRRRVTEENRLPFGRVMGLGTLVIGLALVVYGALALAAEVMGVNALLIVGAVILLAGVVAGLGLSLYGMFKYNKGIF